MPENTRIWKLRTDRLFCLSDRVTEGCVSCVKNTHTHCAKPELEMWVTPVLA